MKHEEFKDKVVFVTGSSRGIGASIAKHFAIHGAKIVIHGRDETAVSNVLSLIRDSRAEAIKVTGELTRFDQIEQMRQEIERSFGTVDILIANAGGSFTAPMPLEEIPEDGWRASIEGNLTATYLTLKSFLPGMKQRKSGNIITIASAAGRIPSTGAPIPYGAAKAGIIIMTQHLASQVGPFNIRVNCIAPETILTERNVERIPIARKAAMLNEHPIKRLGTPDDVAQAALFLASGNASWITGVTLDISGGAVMI